MILFRVEDSETYMQLVSALNREYGNGGHWWINGKRQSHNFVTSVGEPVFEGIGLMSVPEDCMLFHSASGSFVGRVRTCSSGSYFVCEYFQ
jgi:hypothetical protein